MPTITATVDDVTGVSDNTPWVFASVLREGTDGAIITGKKVPVTPVNGVVTVELDPGFAVVTFGGKSYTIVVPSTDADLWDLISVAVAMPPDVPAEELGAAVAAAVAAYINAHPGGGSGGGGPVEWIDILDRPTSFPPSPHTHEESDIDGLAQSLAAKAGQSDLVALTTTVGGKYVKPSTGIPTTDFTVALQTTLAGLDGEVDWVDVQDKPEEFPPSPHTHVVADVAGLEEEIESHQKLSEKGQANGYVPLDVNGKIPSTFVPAGNEAILEFPTLADFPNPGDESTLYVADDTGFTYRWSGTKYVEIVASPGSTDAVPEGQINLYYTDARATAAATAKYETRVAANESGLAAVNVTNTGMAADVLKNSQDITALQTTASANGVAITSLQGAQSTQGGAITDLQTSDAAKYVKPSTGIPATDLESAAQATLTAVGGKYVKPSTGIPATDLVSSVQAELTAAGTAVQPAAMTTAIAAAVSSLTPARQPLGQRSPLTIIPTLTALSSTPGADVPTIAGGVVTSGGSDNRISPSGGTTLLRDQHDASAFCYQWLRTANGGGPIGSPSPTSWSVGFEVYGADEVEFIVNAYSSYFNLTVDGNRVWWTSQDGPTFDPSQGAVFGRYSIKFKLPDTGKYDLRFYMSTMSLESVCMSGNGWLITKPLAGPRCYFMGDRTTMGLTGENFNTIGSWVYWFANLQGLTDVWNDGQANTGPTTGNQATYPLRATATLVPANPKVVFIQGYESDKAANKVAADVATAIGSTIDIARTAANHPDIIVIGSPQFVTGARTAQDIAIAGAIHTVCSQKGVAWIDPQSGEVWNAANQLVLAPAGSWITDANRNAFVDGLVSGAATPSTSLSDLGQSYFGFKMWEAVQLLKLPVFA